MCHITQRNCCRKKCTHLSLRHWCCTLYNQTRIVFMPKEFFICLFCWFRFSGVNFHCRRHKNKGKPSSCVLSMPFQRIIESKATHETKWKRARASKTQTDNLNSTNEHRTLSYRSLHSFFRYNWKLAKVQKMCDIWLDCDVVVVDHFLLLISWLK